MLSPQDHRRGVVPYLVIRRAILTIVVVCLSLAGHASGERALPGAVGLMLATLIAGGLTIAATSTQRSRTWLIGFLVGAQLLIHVVLVISAPDAHAMGGAMPLLPSGSTAVGHLVASMVAAVVLARGEQTLVAWAALLSATFDWLSAAVLEPAVSPTTRCLFAPWTPVPSDRGWDAARRGPPAGLRA